jgi:coronin-7
LNSTFIKDNSQAPANKGLTYRSSNALSTPDRKSRVKSVFYQSKFKYIAGKSAHKSEHITNIRNLSTMWPSECNGFQVNSSGRFAAYLLGGNSGQIGIVDLSKPGRLTDTTINSLVNKAKVFDFSFDPFDENVLAVACEDGCIKLWRIPDEGLECSLEEPFAILTGHLERLYCIKYHPYVKNVLASSSYDRTIKVWNVDTKEHVKTLTGHTDSIFNINWSPCGKKLATVCKDGFVRIYEPLVSCEPVIESKCCPVGSKASRIEWALNGTSLIVSGFGRGNLRQIFLFDSETLNLLHCEDINNSPSLLIPYYDSDTSVLYLYAKVSVVFVSFCVSLLIELNFIEYKKGELTVLLFEIQESEPYFQALSPYKPEGFHYSIAFLPKLKCDVKKAEIAKTYRLTKDNRVEEISFTVPRVKVIYKITLLIFK